MSQALSIYLAATIFVCPLFCEFGQCSPTAERTESVCRGCCHSGGAPSSSDEHSSSPDKDSPGGSCQCICGGAVIDDAGFNVDALDTSWWVPVAIEAPQLVDSHQAEFNRSCAAPWPDDGMNAGRALCCLYSTLLC